MWHLEFTSLRSHKAGRAPAEDNLLGFYVPDRAEWEAAVERMRANGYSPVPSFNPYWDQQGTTFEDPDGYLSCYRTWLGLSNFFKKHL